MQPSLMQKKTHFLILLLMTCLTAMAQPDYTLPLAKPDKYKDKVLGAEKTEDKKFTLPRRLFQGMITHYNYYYNATNKIEAIVQKAKMAHQDDYTEILPFYNYSTLHTAADSSELDSVLYKATAGIVLHDLRNSYVDNLYLLIGKSYFYWRKFDSAYRIFQFINYNFYPKGKDEYFIVVGSNDRATNGDLNLATKEKKGIVQKAFSQPPSRNEALLWLARTYAEDSLFAEASSLVRLLRKDPLFPKRLHDQLNEVQAFVYYKQQIWDSTAYYLQRALPAAANKTELARWEYLLGQLYTLLKQPKEASVYFNKAQTHTTDPVLYIHARIYDAQLVMNTNGNGLQQTLGELVKLSKRERFDGFEDVLFYAAGTTALQIPDTAYAKSLFLQSVKYGENTSPSTRNKSYLKLAGIALKQRDYTLASSCYDSLNYQDPLLADQREVLEAKQTLLKELVKQIYIVKKQDSLQKVARMPEKEMDAYLKALVRKLRKEKGLKEEEANYVAPVAPTTQETPLFNNTSSASGWYFNNGSQKIKGNSEFKSKWGKRPNVDNWRRQSAIDAQNTQQVNTIPGNPGGMEGDVDAKGNTNTVTKTEEEDDDADLSVEGLKQKLPLTEEQLKQSNQKILEALIRQGQIYKNQLEDYLQAALTYEEIFKRFSNYEQEEEVLFELYFCFHKAGNTQKAAYFQSLLNQKYPKGEYNEKVTESKEPKKEKKDELTVTYERIYNLFIEGKFEEALEQKKIADSALGKSYWTPQLLYIQSIYHIRQHQDSLATVTLTDIQTTFPNTPMAEKAGVIKDVLSRRTEIEDYLKNTNIVRQTEDAIVIPFDEGPKVNKIQQQVKDTTTKISIVNKPAQVNTIEKPRPTVEKAGQEKPNKESSGKITVGNKPAIDTSRIKPVKDVKFETAYIYNASEPYVVMIYFDKVDPIYISEAKIAFDRYNASSHSSETIKVNIFEGDGIVGWMDLGPYPDVASVLSYFDELKQNSRQIIPWLATDKYSFLLISQTNLEILKQRKNIEEYKLFIRQYIKDKF